MEAGRSLNRLLCESIREVLKAPGVELSLGVEAEGGSRIFLPSVSGMEGSLNIHLLRIKSV